MAAQAGNCRIIEERRNRDLDVKNSSQRRDDLDRQERIAPELEEALLDVKIVRAQNIFPNIANDLPCRSEFRDGEILFGMAVGAWVKPVDRPSLSQSAAASPL